MDIACKSYNKYTIWWSIQKVFKFYASRAFSFFKFQCMLHSKKRIYIHFVR